MNNSPIGPPGVPGKGAAPYKATPGEQIAMANHASLLSSRVETLDQFIVASEGLIKAMTASKDELKDLGENLSKSRGISRVRESPSYRAVKRGPPA